MAGSAVPFHLTLPDYPEGGPKRCVLAGARLMQYRGEDVAYVAYKVDGHLRSGGRASPREANSMHKILES